jgi:hypothetical protein
LTPLCGVSLTFLYGGPSAFWNNNSIGTAGVVGDYPGYSSDTDLPGSAFTQSDMLNSPNQTSNASLSAIARR